ncbi:MliC family protein [Cupriavidus agavae]|uniref:Membrane-bound lysozyme inhibitor of c-type lysozyme MliC n=1 Tax=Cupriavidus agavae TaxID=1001822 RepID=A0A4Q7RUB1_9BURK|nr:MliC family protein [Cupriavidus agavae]RZT36370.1 membrane-bound lysozyme inhibitor of c-type lysozyme MliC [Cupriavidus agavae]
MPRLSAVSLAAALFGLAPSPQAAPANTATPSFDCRKAEAEIEQMVCKDTTLARLDRETTRLYGLALDARSLPKAQKKQLIAGQRGWIRGRNDCAKADDARDCTVSTYLERIFALRHGYAGARRQDDKGISRGPFNIRCAGVDAVIAGTFVQTDPGYAYLRWLDQQLVLPQTPAASGARYAASLKDGDALFWDKGPDAQLVVPGKPETSCRVDLQQS